MSVIILMILCAVPIFAIGLLIKSGRGLMLIAGYNTMPPEQREQVDKKLLSKTVGNLMLRISLPLAVLGVPIYFGIAWATILLIALICVDTCVTLLALNGKLPEAASKGKLSKRAVIVTAAITAVTLLSVGVTFYFGLQAPSVRVLDDAVQIKGMYGLQVNFADVRDVTLVEQSMDEIGSGSRTNGFALGQALKGHFRLDGGGRVLLFVRANSSPTVKMTRAAEDIYISFADAEQTKALYQELEKALM